MSPKHGISPWVPNQHGAWAMLIAPAVAGTIASLNYFLTDATEGELTWRGPTAVFATLVAWFFGYFTFFALTLVAKARTAQRRSAYARPIYVYGPITAIAAAVTLLAHPALIVWAAFFGPLMSLALWETFHSRPRSMASGISTTLASALLVPVLWMAAHHVGFGAIDKQVWISYLFLALYFSGTVPLVKSMVRERNTPGFVRLSVLLHVGALLIFLAACALSAVRITVPIILMAIILALALLRAWWIPRDAARGHTWTAKKVGKCETPLVVAATVVTIAALL
ncbi:MULTISPECIES: YwiC-like family protein [Corynebacterium]|uniref:YwiC-like family protein n=1 Tax=Corynebacterium TaxID=1716 RepID=UPI002580B05D|nr:MULTISPECIES: YwiC-like family protein [Corynebacterium]